MLSQSHNFPAIITTQAAAKLATNDIKSVIAPYVASYPVEPGPINNASIAKFTNIPTPLTKPY